MSLATRIKWNFPDLETQEKLDEHKAIVLRFISKRQAIFVKERNKIVGVILFLRGRNMICCLAVSPDYRRRGVASMLMDEAFRNPERTKKYQFPLSEPTMKKVLPRERYMRNTDLWRILFSSGSLLRR